MESSPPPQQEPETQARPSLGAAPLRYQRAVFSAAAANAALPVFPLSASQELIVVTEKTCISTLPKLLHTDLV